MAGTDSLSSTAKQYVVPAKADSAKKQDDTATKPGFFTRLFNPVKATAKTVGHVATYTAGDWNPDGTRKEKPSVKVTNVDAALKKAQAFATFSHSPIFNKKAQELQQAHISGSMSTREQKRQLGLLIDAEENAMAGTVDTNRKGIVDLNKQTANLRQVTKTQGKDISDLKDDAAKTRGNVNGLQKLTAQQQDILDKYGIDIRNLKNLTTEQQAVLKQNGIDIKNLQKTTTDQSKKLGDLTITVNNNKKDADKKFDEIKAALGEKATKKDVEEIVKSVKTIEEKCLKHGDDIAAAKSDIAKLKTDCEKHGTDIASVLAICKDHGIRIDDIEASMGLLLQ